MTACIACGGDVEGSPPSCSTKGCPGNLSGVIDLGERRRAKEAVDAAADAQRGKGPAREPLRCGECGGEWFRALVCADTARQITGYGETLTCANCGVEA